MLQDAPLGKATSYIETYSPELLFALPRAWSRDKIGLKSPLPFQGCDLWSSYELSWLTLSGKPQIAMVNFSFPCTSEYLIESKSFKLYLNSFNNTTFQNVQEVKETIQKDLSKAVNALVDVQFIMPSQMLDSTLNDFSGTCLDDLDIKVDTYQVAKDLLAVNLENFIHNEQVYSHLFKSNCLATGQPDWGSVWIKYSGHQICHAGLLKYLISFRGHAGFHEDCVEQIFNDITWMCRPQKLTVYARYNRRGGLDINPFRTNCEETPTQLRLCRQ